MNPNYPETVAVNQANRATIDFFSSLNPAPRVVVVAELRHQLFGVEGPALGEDGAIERAANEGR